jgi:hypothetical protein
MPYIICDNMMKLVKYTMALLFALVIVSLVWYVTVGPEFLLLDFVIWMVLFIGVPTLSVFLIIDRSTAQFQGITWCGILGVVGNIWLFVSYSADIVPQLMIVLSIVLCAGIIYYGYKGIQAKI